MIDEYETLSKLDEKTAYYWQIKYSDGSVHKWSAYPKVRQSGFAVNEAIGYTLVLTTNSKIEYTPA